MAKRLIQQKEDIAERGEEMYQHISYVIRDFLCLKSFESEGRYCNEGETYHAYCNEGNIKFVYENGDMNFTPELFERVVKEWSDVLVETTA